MIEFAGRKVIPTTLDPVPPLFRAVPRHIVLNDREVANLEAEFKMPRGSALPTFARLIAIAQRADEAEQIALTRRPSTTRRRRRSRRG